MSNQQMSLANLRALLEAAAGMKQEVFDRVIDRILFSKGIDPALLREALDEDRSAPQRAPGSRPGPALVTANNRIPAEAYGYSESQFKGPTFRIKGSTQARSVGPSEAVTEDEADDEASEAVPVKRGRGRPKKGEVLIKEVMPCLRLLDDFHITDVRQRKILEAIANEAKENGGRGIPATEGPDNYKPLRRGGPEPVQRLFIINGTKHSVTPPIVAKGGKDTRGDTNAIYVEFEKNLLQIEEVKTSKTEINERQKEIAYADGMEAAGIQWVEAPLADGSAGVPTINAETARKILRSNPAVAEFGEDFIGASPACWLSDEGEWTEEFSQFLRDVWYDKIHLGRIGKFALSRLLMEPLGSVERKLMEIAFPEKYEDKAARELNLEARSDDFGRRKSKNSPKNEAKEKKSAKNNVPTGEKRKRGRPKKVS